LLSGIDGEQRMSRIGELRSEAGPVGRGNPHDKKRNPQDTPRETVRQRLNDRERLQRMAERGEIKLGSGKIPATFWEMPRPDDPNGEVMRALLDERESSL
jgi:hypothetical protein